MDFGYIMDKVLEELHQDIALLKGTLSKYADPFNWGYYDDSGCPKGAGGYTDACFLGPEVAQDAIAVMMGVNNETTGNKTTNQEIP